MPKFRRTQIIVDAVQLKQEIPSIAPVGDWLVVFEDGSQAFITDTEFKTNYTEVSRTRKKSTILNMPDEETTNATEE